MDVKIELNGQIDKAEVIALYRANKWSSADKPEKLMSALSNSHTLVIVEAMQRVYSDFHQHNYARHADALIYVN